jgi:hypothetical protein
LVDLSYEALGYRRDIDGELLDPVDPDFDEHCPIGRWHDPPDPSDDPSPNMHCTCWYDGDGCCRCKAPGLTREQRIEQGMDEED